MAKSRRAIPGTLIRLKLDTKALLMKKGRKGESYDDIIRRLVGRPTRQKMGGWL